MTFLNPAVLFGLAAVAIPVILHLLNLRKLRTVEFSTLAFLKQLQKSKMRRLKLRQILLLILRTLVIACLVLAFARPALRGTTGSGFGQHPKTSIILLLDDSFSMSAADEYGSLFHQAKAASLDILSLLREGDEVFFQKFSGEFGNEATKTLTHDFSAVKSAVDETKISMTFHSLGEILENSENALKGSRNLNKEVYVISDLQRTNFAPGENRSVQSTKPLSELFDNHTTFFLVPVGRAQTNNVAVEAVKMMNRIFEKDRPFSLEATIRNYESTPLRNYTASLYLDGKRVMQKSVDIPGSGAMSLTFTGVPKRTGYVSGYVQCEADPIEPDNERYFTIFVPERTDILFVTNSTRDISYLTLALSADERSRSSYTTESIPPSRLLMTPLSRYDVIVLCNVKSFSATEAERIRRFVADGGGVLLFPGPDVDIAQYAADFCRILRIAPFTGRNENPGDQGSFLTFEKVDFAHPIFSEMFETNSSEKKRREPSIESPHIRRTMEYHPSLNGQTIIRLSNESSFLTEYKIGNGRLLLYTISPTLDWSDFPVKGIFVPLIRRSIAYLGTTSEQTVDHLAGNPVTIPIPLKAFGARQVSTIAHKSPDGEEEIVQASASERGGARVFTVRRTDVPGIHEIIRDNEVVSAFSINVDPRESDVRTLSVDEAVQWLTRRGLRPDAINTLRLGEHIEAAILHSRFGVELWKYFLGFALLFALTEMMVGSSKKEETEAEEE